MNINPADVAPHMTAMGLVDIPARKNKALVSDWHRLRGLARDQGYNLHQCNDKFELAGGELNREIWRFNTLLDVQTFLTRE